MEPVYILRRAAWLLVRIDCRAGMAGPYPYRLSRIDMLAPEDEHYAHINPKHQTPTLLLTMGESLARASRS